MICLKSVELYDRGLKDFQALSPLERDFFVLNDLDIYYEMEGGFADYLSSGGHESELRWLADTLQRIGDADSAELMVQLRRIPNPDYDAAASLCDRYYDLRHRRWDLFQRYLAHHDAYLDESP